MTGVQTCALPILKTHRRGYREAAVEKKLKFGSAESMEGVKNAETVKKAEQKRQMCIRDRL